MKSNKLFPLRSLFTAVATALLALTAVLLLLVGPAAWGQQAIPIDNPGFENPVLADGNWDYSLDNEGWGYFDNDGYLGPWNVFTSDYPAEAPEGQNVGWAEPGTNAPGGFAQVLTNANATLQEGMKYTLSVKVGASLSYSSGGYLVQLLAGGTPHTPGSGGDYTGPVTGGTLLAQDSNTVTIAAGTFSNVVVTYTYDPAQSSLLGQPLQIRLLALPGGDETEFDEVQLVASSVTTLPRIIGFGPLSGSSFPLTFTGQNGQNYKVLTSPNVALPMASWTVLTNGTFGASPETYTDTGATNTQQFYRIQSP